jgi:hypothetical protein
MRSFTRVRVPASELVSIRNRIAGDGEPYGGADLDGAIMDMDHALFEKGFTDPKVSRTGDIERMIVLRCEPVDGGPSPDEVIDRLEAVWITRGAFTHEAHSIRETATLSHSTSLRGGTAADSSLVGSRFTSGVTREHWSRPEVWNPRALGHGSSKR